MDIIEFNKKSKNLVEKYAPTTIEDIIGARRQVVELESWLFRYNMNARKNLAKQDTKKGKKVRRRKVQKKKNEDSDNNDNENDIENNDKDKTNEDLELPDTAEVACNSIGNDDGDALDDELLDLKKVKKKDPNMCQCAIVTGEHGTGKTAVVRAVLNGMGYIIKSVNFAKLGAIKSVDDFIENLLTMDDIFEIIQNKKVKKFAVLVDDIHSVSTPTEKNVINGLLRLNSEMWACPVIFIGSNKHKKFMTAIKKECYHISMYVPSEIDLSLLFERVGMGEGMKFENEDVVVDIVKHSQGDYRRLLVTMGELLRIHETRVIKNTDLEKYIKYAGEKDVDGSIYENTTLLFANYNGINSALKLFEKGKTDMPLMIHQNHFLATNGYIKDKTKSIDVSADLAMHFAHGDVVDNFIYSDQNWSLQETYGFYSCVYPSFKMKNEIDTEKLIHDSKYPYHKPAFSTQYPKDLNRTSTRCINYKNVKFANEYFRDMSIEDYVLAVKLIKSMLEDGRVKECEAILKEYNLSAQGIMYVLKIDKINGTRKDVSKTIEKKVKEIAVEPVKAAVIRKY
jgi:hypothetical protein